MSIFEELFRDDNFDVLNNLERWNGTRLIRRESVSEHSFLVILFARIMAEEIFEGDSKSILQVIDYATFHDVDEMITYDVNHIVKYNPHNGEDIRRELDKFVDWSIDHEIYFKEDKYSKLIQTNILNKNTLPEEIKNIVKVADWLACSFYIYKEINIGNKPLIHKYKLCITKLHESCRLLIETLFFKQLNDSIIYDIINSKFELQ